MDKLAFTEIGHKDPYKYQKMQSIRDNIAVPLLSTNTN